MYTINQYVKVKSLEEAYELNQKRMNAVLGGTLWLRLGSRAIQTAIDLSGLGLDQIEETEEAFVIGCMTPLRVLEQSEALNAWTQGAVRDCISSIVGTQFRNMATIGGTIFGRFGFSDVLTCLLVLDTEVVLYKGGRKKLADFVKEKPDRDILVQIVIKKTKRSTGYEAFRLAATDFPVLTCAVSRSAEGKVRTAVGARPNKAFLIEDEDELLMGARTEESIEKYLEFVGAKLTYGSNMRGSAEYRCALTGVLIRRALEKASREV